MEEFKNLDELLSEEKFDDLELVEAAADDPVVPFWRIDKAVLAPLVKVMKDISQRNSDQISKTVLFERDASGKVRVSMTNKDISFTGFLPLKNDQNQMEGSLILLLKQIDDILKFSADLLVYKKDEKPVAILLKGDQPLDEFKFSVDLYRKGDELGKPGNLDYLELVKEVTLFNNLMSLANVVEDKRIVVKGGYAYGLFISTLVRAQSQLTDLVMKNTDIRDLLGLLSIYKDSVKIGVTKEKFIVRGAEFQYSSLKVSGEIAESEVSKFSAAENLSGSVLDATHAYNVFSYLTVTNSDTAVAKVVNEDGILYVSCKNRQGVTTRFQLTGGSDLVGFDTQISVSKNVFRVIRSFTSLEMLLVGPGMVMYRAPGLEIIQGVRGLAA